jgi:hypothetical protein
MSIEEFERTLKIRLQRQPFETFVIEMLDGEQYTVTRPRAIMYPFGGESAVFFHDDGINLDFVYSDGVRHIRDCPLAASA